MIVDLNFHRAKQGRDFFVQTLSINNVTAFHGGDFVFSGIGLSPTTSINFTALRSWAVRIAEPSQQIVAEALVPSAFSAG
jgi:hypothetical protein